LVQEIARKNKGRMRSEKKTGDKIMKKGRTAEEIILKLRKIEILVKQGKTIVQASREEGISDYTYYRWRREYGGLNIDQAKELKKLKQENEKLKKAVAELTLDKLILNEALSGIEDRRSQNTKPSD
jgi:transposase-like protein